MAGMPGVSELRYKGMYEQTVLRLEKQWLLLDSIEVDRTSMGSTHGISEEVNLQGFGDKHSQERLDVGKECQESLLGYEVGLPHFKEIEVTVISKGDCKYLDNLESVLQASSETEGGEWLHMADGAMMDLWVQESPEEDLTQLERIARAGVSETPDSETHVICEFGKNCNLEIGWKSAYRVEGAMSPKSERLVPCKVGYAHGLRSLPVGIMSYRSLRGKTAVVTTGSGVGTGVGTLSQADGTRGALGWTPGSMVESETALDKWDLFWELLEPQVRERIMNFNYDSPELEMVVRGASASREQIMIKEKIVVEMNQGKVKRGKKCWACGEVGHRKKSCNAQQAMEKDAEEALNSGKPGSKDNSQSCWVCEERGHLKADCPIWLARKAERMKKWGI